MHKILEHSLDQLVIHFVGNKVRETECILSQGDTVFEDETNKSIVEIFFIKPFLDNQAYYQFYDVNGLDYNTAYKTIKSIFLKEKSLIEGSQILARHLYENTIYPQIKDGEFYIALFDNCIYNNEPTNAIGIFKSETKNQYLKVNNFGKSFQIENDAGIDVRKLDKGCIIFNIDGEDGYKISLVDNSSKSNDNTKYWTDLFLGITPCSDSYHTTQKYLHLTKDFIVNEIDNSFEVNKIDKSDLLNKSIDYFKKNERFNQDDFNAKVFRDVELIKTFDIYKSDQTICQPSDIESDFFISSQAVKKQARVFKSVLKLDKNFHIYIHGNREMIESGVDETGRKFYKIYYQNEE